MTARAHVAVARGEDRCGNLSRALDLHADEIVSSIRAKGSKTLFVKVNAIDSNFPLACTHPRALECVLLWFAPHFERIIVGDNSFVFSRLKDRHPYAHLGRQFPQLTFSDLSGFGRGLLELRGVDDTVTEAPYSLLPQDAYTVSLSIPKTHDAATFTGCSKNMFGCILKNRLALHAVTPIGRVSIRRLVKANAFIQRNLAEVIAKVPADLAIMDAFEGMEGQGPIFGTAVRMKLALVSTDRIAVDTLACELAHLPLPEYLDRCGGVGLGCARPSEIALLGNDFSGREELERAFRPHYLQAYQLMRELPRGWSPRLDLRLVLAYARRFHRLRDKMRETWEHNRAEGARAAFHA